MPIIKINVPYRHNQEFKEGLELAVDFYVEKCGVIPEITNKYKNGVFFPTYIERLGEINNFSSLSVIQIVNNFDSILTKIQQIDGDMEEIEVLLDALETLEDKTSTSVYEFEKNGFLKKVGSYKGEFNLSGFRWNENKQHVYEGSDLGNSLSIVGKSYSQTRHVLKHLKKEIANKDNQISQRKNLESYVPALETICNPKTFLLCKRQLPT